MKNRQAAVHRSFTGIGLGFALLVLGWSASGSAISAQERSRTLVRTRYVETKLYKGASRAPVVLEEGTCTIDPDGRYRVERNRGGSRTAEVVDLRQNRRSDLDLDNKVAVVSPASGQNAGSTLIAGMPQVTDSEAAPQRQRGQDLGSRILASGLAVEGVRFTFNLRQSGSDVTLVQENWYYRFPDRRMSPVLLESRFEDGDTITTKRVVEVSQLPIDEEIFAVPADFATTIKPGAVIK